MIIYKITNLVNSKILIGQTTRTLKRRWSEYQSDARNRPKRAIEHAINKYGVENFTIEVVDMCDDLDDLNKKEINWISHFNSTCRDIGYNVESGGNNSPVAESTREKLSEIFKGRVLTQEWKDKISKSNMGRIISEENKQKLREFNLGKKRSLESRQKQSESIRGEKNHQYGKPLPEATFKAMIEKNSKKIIRDDGTLYKSITEAAEDVKVHHSAISNNLRGKSKTCRGYTFKYL